MDRVLKIFAGLGLLFVLLCMTLGGGAIGWIANNFMGHRYAVYDKDRQGNVIVPNGDQTVVIPAPVPVPAYTVQQVQPRQYAHPQQQHTPQQYQPAQPQPQSPTPCGAAGYPRCGQAAGDDGFRIIPHAPPIGGDDGFRPIRRQQQ